MNGKKMAPRLWVHIGDGTVSIVRPSHCDSVEYVRADIISGDANEPLKDGQYRWIKIFDDEAWMVARVCIESEFGTAWFETYGGEFSKGEISSFGNVIRPPEDA